MPKKTGTLNKTSIKKMTVSLPKYLVDLADELANERKTSRSKVVSTCLEDLAKKRKIERMEAGYRALAEEHSNFAREVSQIAYEVLEKEE